MNPRKNETFDSKWFSAVQWWYLVNGVNTGQCCLFCTEPHYSDECPYYPTAAERLALFKKQGRCIYCLAYHPGTACRLEWCRNLCRFRQCGGDGVTPIFTHNKIFCELASRDLSRQNNKDMPLSFHPSMDPPKKSDAGL